MTKSSKQNIMISVSLIVLMQLMVAFIGRRGYPSSLIFTMKNTVNIGIIAVWSASVKNRMLPSDARKYVISAAQLMIFGMVLTIARHRIIGIESRLGRISWYGYYATFILVPLLFFLSSIYFGRRENDEPSKKWTLLFIPAILLLAGVLSNDFHHFVFQFEADSEGYSYNWMYYIIFAWCAMMTMLGMLSLLRMNRFAGKRNNALLPIFFLLLCPILLAIRAIALDGAHYLPNVIEIFSFTYIAAWESCIQKEFIPHNIDYNAIFVNLNVSAGVADNQYNTVYHTAGLNIDYNIIQQALKSPVLADKDSLVFAKPLSVGYAYWKEDQSAVNRLNEELEEANSLLSEENDLIAAENEISERDAKIKEKSRIYHQISASLYDKLVLIRDTLTALDMQHTDSERKYAYICLIGAYIKRRTNLMLLASENAYIRFEEVALSLNESVKFLNLYGISSGVRSANGGLIESQSAIKIYDIFEMIAEHYLDTATGVLVYLQRDSLRIAVEGVEPFDALPFGVSAEYENGVCYFTACVGEGGDGK